jgi:hypothetical protein
MFVILEVVLILFPDFLLFVDLVDNRHFQIVVLSQIIEFSMSLVFLFLELRLLEISFEFC